MNGLWIVALLKLGHTPFLGPASAMHDSRSETFLGTRNYLISWDTDLKLGTLGDSGPGFQNLLSKRR
jgi:hypothetical protein